MENYELYIDSPPKRKNNWFPKGHIPFNKGRPQKEWMDGRKIKRVNRYLEIGRHLGNHDLPGSNSKKIVGIKDGKLIAFKNAITAETILRKNGIEINRRNINKVCHGKSELVQKKYNIIRKTAGGYQWFFADDVEKYKIFVK
jgi:hypothetical protein